MALTRRLPISNYILSESTLETLLRSLSRHYEKSDEKYHTPDYTLVIHEDEHTASSYDDPPEDFTAALCRPITNLSLTIQIYKPKRRRLEFSISHGDSTYRNNVTFSGDDENWVNLAYFETQNILASVERQNTIFRRYWIPIGLLIALPTGWALDKIFSFILVLTSQIKLVPWTWPLFFQHLVISLIFGSFFTILIYAAILKNFPSIEIHTGPSHTWKEARRRKVLGIILGVLIVAPLGNLIYDLYKALFA